MTLRIPKPNKFDMILKLLGKKRAVHIPKEMYERFGPYVYLDVKPENFFRTLFRSNSKRLPERQIYVDDLQANINSVIQTNDPPDKLNK